MTPLSIVIDRVGDGGLLLAYLAVMLLALAAILTLVKRAGRLVSAFFGGVRAANEEPVTGYADPGAPRRTR
jgi:hypothetical protein